MQKKNLASIDALEIEALTDKELEMVEGGGIGDITNLASCSCCVAGATNIGKPAI